MVGIFPALPFQYLHPYLSRLWDPYVFPKKGVQRMQEKQ
jgi:hypothetical protein